MSTPKASPRRPADDEPTIKSAAPSRKGAAGGASATRQGNPDQFWRSYYEKADESPLQAFKTVAELAQAKEFVQVEAAIKAYLNARPKLAEPWMYEWLVKTIELRKGPTDLVNTYLSYAAFLAKRTNNPNDLVRIADMLVIRNIDGVVGEGKMQTSVGELIDRAAEVAPVNAVPPMMSINLAVRTKDPKRMGDSAERLLSLGWPGLDDQMRRNARKQFDELAKSLRDDGRTEEAEAMLARWPEIAARDLFLKLTWTGEADIDLAVDEPLGATASFANPRTVFGGAIIKNGYGKHPEEVYVCPRAFGGDYKARVEVIFNDPAKPVTEVTLEVIQHEGSPEETRQTHTIKLADPRPIVFHLAEGRRKAVLPFIPPPDRPVIDAKSKPAGAIPGQAPIAPAAPGVPASDRPKSPPIRP